MEIEIRAQIHNIKDLAEVLKAEAEFIEAHEENDLYLRHASDTERTLILRIRRTSKGSELTFKGKAKGCDTAWADVDLPLLNPDDLERLLLSNNYVKVVSINKHRSTFKMGCFEINLDEIDDLGDFIEIEGRGTENERNSIEEKIIEILSKLSISNSDIIRRGYVSLMLEKNRNEKST